jgi:rubrerythrin
MGMFTLDEVLKIAMQAEATGMSLYEVMAKETKDPKVIDLFRQLAGQEKPITRSSRRCVRVCPPARRRRG